MRVIKEFARRYPRETAIALAALLLAGVFQGISFTAILPALDVAMASEEGGPADDGRFIVQVMRGIGLEPTLGPLLMLITVGILLKSLLVLFAKRRVGHTVARIATDLRLNLLQALLNARWNYYLHQPIGVLTNAMATEASRASSAYLSATRVTASLIEAIVYATVALFISWQATLIALLAGLTVVYGFGRLVRAARRAGKRQTRLQKSLVERLTDALLSVKSLKAMGLENRGHAILEAETGRLNKALRKQVTNSEALAALYEPAIVLLICIGLYLAVRFWDVPLANVLVLVLLLVRVLGTLSRVQRYYQRLGINESAYWSLLETVHSAERAHESTSVGRDPVFENDIVFDRVGFAYAGKPVISGLSLRIAHGSFTTLVGPSGSGKTTLIDLVTGLHRSQTGQVCIDGVPLGELKLEAWRRMIGYVPQETLLLHDTVMYNVTLGDPAFGESETEQALKAAGAWDFVSKLPEGMQSLVGERGGMLSGGQRQRLCIARALVRKPRLLILDEATSALDPASEAAICDTLDGLRGAITILAISHQSGLARIADRVVHLRDGAVEQESDGTLAGELSDA
jgi:ATP-binding cassette subfamily C protein